MRIEFVTWRVNPRNVIVGFYYLNRGGPDRYHLFVYPLPCLMLQFAVSRGQR